MKKTVSIKKLSALLLLFVFAVAIFFPVMCFTTASSAEKTQEINVEESIEPRIDLSFLSLAIVSESGGKWRIRVTNTTDQDITFEYNTRRCYKSDAENWTGLKHIETREVEANDSVIVTIEDYIWADAVAVSYLGKGKRLISFGYDMDKKSRTMQVDYKTI